MTETKSDRAAAEFKAAARRVFARQGYAKTKITDITAEAGRATGGIYRYFASKSAVLKALTDDFLAALHDRVADAAGHGHTMTTEDDVREHVVAYWQTYREFLPEMAAISEASVSDPMFADIWHQMRGRDYRLWLAHVQEMRAHIGKSVDHAPSIARMVLSLLEGYCYKTLVLGEGVGSSEVDGQDVEALAKFVHGGIIA